MLQYYELRPYNIQTCTVLRETFDSCVQDLHKDYQGNY